MNNYPSVREALRRSEATENAKVSKTAVAYEHPAAKAQHCGICEHWEPSGHRVHFMVMRGSRRTRPTVTRPPTGSLPVHHPKIAAVL